MGIENIIARNCIQTAVYWENPKPDGKGGNTYDDPVEIDCRWEEKTEVLSRLGDDRKGEELVSEAQVIVTQDVDEKGYLFLGDLDDLDSDEEGTPEKIKGAYRILKFDKIPALRNPDEYMRKAYL